MIRRGLVETPCREYAFLVRRASGPVIAVSSKFGRTDPDSRGPVPIGCRTRGFMSWAFLLLLEVLPIANDLGGPWSDFQRNKEGHGSRTARRVEVWVVVSRVSSVVIGWW